MSKKSLAAACLPHNTVSHVSAQAHHHQHGLFMRDKQLPPCHAIPCQTRQEGEELCNLTTTASTAVRHEASRHCMPL